MKQVISGRLENDITFGVRKKQQRNGPDFKEMDYIPEKMREFWQSDESDVSGFQGDTEAKWK